MYSVFGQNLDYHTQHLTAMAIQRLFLPAISALLLLSLLSATPDDRTIARKERYDRGNRIEEIIYHDKLDQIATVRTYSTGGVLQMEEQYQNYTKRQKSGFTKYWYPSGKLYWVSDYKNNVKHGSFIVYNEDGTLKRREYYKNGVPKKATCYGSGGEAVNCTSFLRDAEFTNGMAQLNTFIQHYIDRDPHPRKAPRLLVRFDVNTDGSIENLFFILPSEQGKVDRGNSSLSEHDDAAFLMDAFEDMPRWKPAMFDDIPIRSTISLSVRYKKGELKLAPTPKPIVR